MRSLAERKANHGSDAYSTRARSSTHTHRARLTTESDGSDAYSTRARSSTHTHARCVSVLERARVDARAVRKRARLCTRRVSVRSV